MMNQYDDVTYIKEKSISITPSLELKLQHEKLSMTQMKTLYIKIHICI